MSYTVGAGANATAPNVRTYTIKLCAYDPDDEPAELPEGHNVYADGSLEEEFTSTALPADALADSYRVDVDTAFALSQGGDVVIDIETTTSGDLTSPRSVLVEASSGSQVSNYRAYIGGEQVRIKVRTREGVTGTEPLDGATIAALDGTQLEGVDLNDASFTAAFTTPTTFNDIVASFVGPGGPRPFLTPDGAIAIPCKSVDPESTAAETLGFDVGNSTGTMPTLDKLIPSTSEDPEAGGTATIRVVVLVPTDTTF